MLLSIDAEVASSNLSEPTDGIFGNKGVPADVTTAGGTWTGSGYSVFGEMTMLAVMLLITWLAGLGQVMRRITSDRKQS